MAGWRRTTFLLHRWLGIGLGLLVLVWFASAIAMIFYPWPAPTESETLSRLAPFDPPADLLPPSVALGRGPEIVGARLMVREGRLVYVPRGARDGLGRPGPPVDAHTGSPVAPLSSADAVGVARSVVGRTPREEGATLLPEGDHYLLSAEYRPGFPAWRIRFTDPDRTAVYVSRRTGDVVGVVTRRTRWTTWLGTVPHWLYFEWLYRRGSLWLWASIVLPGIAVLGGLTGIVFGAAGLFPRRRRGVWTVSPYRGVSKWHHVAGIVFGALVVTWSLSGLLEVLGPDGSPSAEQLRRVRGPAPDWGRVAVGARDAYLRAARSTGDRRPPVALDLEGLAGVPGWLVHFRDGRTAWVDAVTGEVRGELGALAATALARRALGLADSVPARGVDHLDRYDDYYYARPGREKHLPVWRVSFRAPGHPTLYLRAVSGRPVGYADARVRRWRWWRDGLHGLDFPGLLAHRSAWEAVLLALVLGGAVSAATGVWLAVRRMRRML